MHSVKGKSNLGSSKWKDVGILQGEGGKSTTQLSAPTKVLSEVFSTFMPRMDSHEYHPFSDINQNILGNVHINQMLFRGIEYFHRYTTRKKNQCPSSVLL